MSDIELKNTTVTFGKYKDQDVSAVLRDRKYCKWLIDQEWFKTSYEFLYNKVKEYDPRVYFLPQTSSSSDFLESFPYFNLTPVHDLKITLTENETSCYSYYLYLMESLKLKILERLVTSQENAYDIKAPTKWLQKFESTYGLNREVFKEFITSYELPNVTDIIEIIKREGGIEYNGAKSFKIAKARSLEQEQWWEVILKEKYGEDLSVQFKYQNCFFDFLHISKTTIYECKLGLKDFNEEQHMKYLKALEEYKVVYLIGYDTIVDCCKAVIYTTIPDLYQKYIQNVPEMKNPSKFDVALQKCTIESIKSVREFILDTNELDQN